MAGSEVIREEENTLEKPGTITPAKKVSKPAHPKTSEMVKTAIKELKERGGSSLQAIKKFIAANYSVDAERLAQFIRRYLKSAVASGALLQTKGKGASGSFEINGKWAAEKPAGAAAAAVPSQWSGQQRAFAVEAFFKANDSNNLADELARAQSGTSTCGSITHMCNMCKYESTASPEAP